jgi:hypothetical protein
MRSLGWPLNRLVRFRKDEPRDEPVSTMARHEPRPAEIAIPDLERRITATEVLFLATAVALGAVWVIETRSRLEVFALSNRDRLVFRQSLHLVAAFLTPLTLGLFVLTFRNRRASLPSLFRQPGVAACAVAAILLMLEVANHFLDLTNRFADVSQLTQSGPSYALSSPRLRGFTLLDSLAFSLGEAPGLAVAGAYLALCTTALWRAQSTWIDRAGRLLGWLWIIIALAFVVLPPWSP